MNFFSGVVKLKQLFLYLKTILKLITPFFVKTPEVRIGGLREFRKNGKNYVS